MESPFSVFKYKQYQKTTIIVSIFDTSHMFTISHIFTHFSVDTMCVIKREVTVQKFSFKLFKNVKKNYKNS